MPYSTKQAVSTASCGGKAGLSVWGGGGGGGGGFLSPTPATGQGPTARPGAQLSAFREHRETGVVPEAGSLGDPPRHPETGLCI
mmetsp:Transcript_23293/g.37776  ORF Transcript_23293/g.37776 Transcript_23293/m.37776 type:complete len:84 (+) Transcript_23293:38-289(+)